MILRYLQLLFFIHTELKLIFLKHYSSAFSVGFLTLGPAAPCCWCLSGRCWPLLAPFSHAGLLLPTLVSPFCLDTHLPSATCTVPSESCPTHHPLHVRLHSDVSHCSRISSIVLCILSPLKVFQILWKDNFSLPSIILYVCLLAICLTRLHFIIQYFPLVWGETFQDPRWVPETVDHTKSYAHCFFLYVHTCDEV